MASEVEEVLIRIRADVNQATSEILKIQQSLDRTEKSSKNFISSLAGWAKAAGLILLAKQAFQYVSEETIQSEKALAQLNATLSSTNYAVGLSAQQIQKMAESMSEMTAIDDEVIMTGQNLLLTFTRIGGDVFPKATEAMLDMSVALGQDVKNSAIQLGKALNNPIEGVTALQRVGVMLSDEQKNLIKSFMAVNDIASAQQVILDELNNEFGGSAAAQLQTYGGQLNALSVSAGNFAASIGDWIGLKDIMHGVRVALDGLTMSGKDWTEKYAEIYDPLESVMKGAAKGAKEGQRQKPTSGPGSDVEKQMYAESIRVREEYNKYIGNIDGMRIVEEQGRYGEALQYARENNLSAEDVELEHQANLEQIEADSLQRRTEKYQTYIGAVTGFANQMLNSLSTAFSKQAANEIASGDRKYKVNQFLAGALIKDEEKKKKALQLLEIQHDLFEMRVKRRAFERDKGLQIASATISMLTGAVQAFQSMLVIPVVGVILGAVAAAAVLAFGAVNIAMISSTRAPMLAEGGLIQGTSAGTPIVAGERGMSEAIIPLDNPEAQAKLGGMGVTYNISLDGSFLADQDIPERVAEAIDRALYKLDRRRNSVFAAAMR